MLLEPQSTAAMTMPSMRCALPTSTKECALSDNRPNIAFSNDNASSEFPAFTSAGSDGPSAAPEGSH